MTWQAGVADAPPDRLPGTDNGLGRVSRLAGVLDALEISEPIAAGLASAYFLVSFLFAGYALKLYVEVRGMIGDLEHEVDSLKYVETLLEEGWEPTEVDDDAGP